jgi:DNA-binding response OmpR family regulator
MKDRLRVALVEDETRLRRSILRDLRKHFDVFEYEDVPAPKEAEPVDVVILDLKLARTIGVSSIEEARRAWPLIPIVVWTGWASEREHADWIASGKIDTVVKKPTDPAELVRAVWHAYARREGRTPEAAVDDLCLVLGEVLEEDVTN